MLMSEDKKSDEANKEMIATVVNKQIEMAETLGEIKATLVSIDKHTSVMNEELGACKEDIATSKKDIAELKNRTIFKLTWKELAKISGSIGTVVTVIITILKFVFHM